MRANYAPELLKDKSISLITDFSKNADLLLISFAGVGIGMGVPYFEFLKLIDSAPIKKVFVRDLQKHWYHAGLQGLSTNIDQTATILKDIVKESGATRVLTLGNSMGGYAAILFGALLQVDEVLAFGTITFGNWKNRLRYMDFRPLFRHLHRSPRKDPKYYDLAKIPGIGKPQIHLYFDTDYREDRIHAQHLAKAGKNIHLHPCHIGGKHHVIKKLKEQGTLKQIITQTINRLSS